MIPVTTQELAALKDSPRVKYLLEFTIGATTYRLSNTDSTEVNGLNQYIPGFIDEMPDIEITSDPKTNDVSIELADPERIFITAFLSQPWMNRTCTIFKVIEDKNGDVILTKNAFQGFLSDFSINSEQSTIEITASSIWADFEKTAGIKTNAKSQQRYYPTDTAFEHSSKAIEKVYWGKDAPGVSGGTVGGGSRDVGQPQADQV
jgi:hypothetical protein